MRLDTGNLSTAERIASLVLGLGLAAVALRRPRALLSTAVGTAALSMLARSAAGHCGVKSALAGHSSLRDGLIDQWRCLVGRKRAGTGLPGSPKHTHQSRAVDQAVDESFPASDPPASRLPDEPPANAEAKWAAARKT